MACWKGGEHLERHEDNRDQRQRIKDVVTPLHRPHKRADGDGKQGGQNSAQHEHGPPRQREGAVDLGQDREEPPLVAREQACDHP